MAKSIWLDGLKRIKRPPKKRRIKFNLIYLTLFLFGLFLISFFFLGKLGAQYLSGKIEPISLFKDGKFLVLFQNNAEIRSSGGFIGSYAILEINNFEIRNLIFNTNIYALDRVFAQKNFVKAPAPVADMTKNQTWALRDANYDADFQDAAQDIVYFFQRETGDSVDGIIALNAKVIQDLLKISGPIKLANYHTVITADNFYNETQYKIEKEYFQNPQNWLINEPKTFLKDLYPEILKKALEKKIALGKLVQQELKSKEMILFFNDPTKEKIAKKQNWAGDIPDEKELKDLFETNLAIDYLYINSNSYSGNKSSINIEEEIANNINYDQATGRQKVNLKITRRHQGSYIFPDGKNTTWMRILVPEGVALLEGKIDEENITENISVGNEADKTFLATNLVLEPGQEQILELSYLLPDTIGPNNYHLLVQKQPGVMGQKLQINLDGKILFDGGLGTDKKISG